MKDRTSENNPRRTDDKNSISLKIDINIMKDIPILQRQVENGKVKATQLPRCHGKHLPPEIFNLKIFRQTFPQCIRELTEEKGKEQSTQARDKITFVQK